MKVKNLARHAGIQLRMPKHDRQQRLDRACRFELNHLEGRFLLASPGGSALAPTDLSAASLSISGYVYSDENNSGTRDPGEAGIAGVRIVLTRDQMPETLFSISTETDSNGHYIFVGLIAGFYTITEQTQPVGYLDGQDTADNITPIVGSNAADVVSKVLLDPTTTVNNVNFGELPPVQISLLFTNDDGSQELEASPTITGVNDLGTVTSGSGSDPLRPGTYLIGVEPSFGLPGPGGGPPPLRVKSEVIHHGPPATILNYSLTSDTQSSGVNGSVYVDANGNGIRDRNEPGIPGVQIILTQVPDLNPLAVTDTDQSGDYQFANIPFGTYTISEPTQPAGFSDGQDTLGNVVPLPNSVGRDSINTVVALNTTVGQANFGERRGGSQLPAGGSSEGTTIRTGAPDPFTVALNSAGLSSIPAVPLTAQIDAPMTLQLSNGKKPASQTANRLT